MTQTNTADPEVGTVAAGQTSNTKRKLAILTLGAIGVVYGDIGTSPLYAFREAMHISTGEGAAADIGTVLGLLSLIAWALTILVTIKYIGIVLRADNKGEGGTLSLMALAHSSFEKRPAWLLFMGIVGASLFYGDAMITPALSVLAAVEGLQVVAPAFEDWVVPITLVVIVALFSAQRFGTGGVASVFGPITSVWFLALAASGIYWIANAPEVLLALNPYYAVKFVVDHTGVAAVTFGAVFLAVTGAEAIYADLGHFGRRPIVIAWLFLAFPCLVINYFGQGAYTLYQGEVVQNPFFEMQLEWARLPMLILATMATVIASQAVITGAFSLTQQAVQLNLLPRLNVLHTSETTSGQVYMPQVNSMLFIAVVLLVVGFGSSSSLGHAYGIAVTSQFLVTDFLLAVVMIRLWGWKWWIVAAVLVPIGLIEFLFFASNVAKIASGGWLPVVVALALITIMLTWTAGRRRLAEKTRKDEVPLQFLVDNLSKKKPTTVPGTAIFLTSDIEGAPTALLHSLKHYKVLHDNNVILTVHTSSSPRVADDEKVHYEAYNELFSRAVVTFGYMEEPNIPKALALARKLGWKFDIMSTSFFLSRRSLKLGQKGGPLRFWQDRLFIRLARNASDATEYFHIPTGRVVEIGTQLVL